jgi:hypothetical protein
LLLKTAKTFLLYLILLNIYSCSSKAPRDEQYSLEQNSQNISNTQGGVYITHNHNNPNFEKNKYSITPVILDVCKITLKHFYKEYSEKPIPFLFDPNFSEPSTFSEIYSYQDISIVTAEACLCYIDQVKINLPSNVIQFLADVIGYILYEKKLDFIAFKENSFGIDYYFDAAKLAEKNGLFLDFNKTTGEYFDFDDKIKYIMDETKKNCSITIEPLIEILFFHFEKRGLIKIYDGYIEEVLKDDINDYIIISSSYNDDILAKNTYTVRSKESEEFFLNNFKEGEKSLVIYINSTGDHVIIPSPIISFFMEIGKSPTIDFGILWVPAN